jgi:hypothetical protein
VGLQVCITRARLCIKGGGFAKTGASADWGATRFQTEFGGAAADASTSAPKQDAPPDLALMGQTTSLEEVDATIDREAGQAMSSGAAQVREPV